MTERKNMPDARDLIDTLKIQAKIAREERAKADALFLSIGEGVIATDEKGKIIRVNQRACQMLGFERRELVGKWFPKRIRAVTETGEAIRLMDRPMTKVFVSGKPVTQKAFYLRKDSSVMPVQLTISPVLLRGKPVGAIEIFRDITLENEMDRLKADFISLASHQLRTPLAAVQTYTNMLLQGYVGAPNETQKTFLETILGASERMNELISTLLNITRVEADNLLIHNGDVDLVSLSAEVCEELSKLATDKNIAVSIADTEAPLVIESDTALIHEILANLLTNAIKYTPENGKVTVKLVQKNRHVMVHVTDTGFGIPLSEQDHIFTKFYRATNILKRDTTGTGLGLYLVKNIAERLGGELTFKSHENKGTTFTLTIPITMQPSDPKIALEL